MLHFLSVLLLFLLFAVVIAIAVGAYLLNKGIRMFRKAADKATGRQTHTEADGGRRGRASGRGGGTAHTATGETHATGPPPTGGYSPTTRANT